MPALVALTLVLSVATQPADAQEESLHVGVLPPKLYRGARRLLSPAILNEALLAAIQNAGNYEVIGQSDMTAVLSFERQKDLAGCDDTSCFAEIGGALGVEYLIDIKIGGAPEGWDVSMKVIDIGDGTPRVLGRHVVRLNRDPGVVMESLPFITRELLAGAGLPLKAAARGRAAPWTRGRSLADVAGGARADALRLKPCLAVAQTSDELEPGINEITMYWVVEASGSVRLARMDGPTGGPDDSLPSCVAARMRLQVFPRLAPMNAPGARYLFVPYGVAERRP